MASVGITNAGTLLFVTGLFIAPCLLTVVIRFNIRQRDRIPGCCGLLDDCLLSYCCWHCTLAQMVRHESAQPDRYHFCSSGKRMANADGSGLPFV